MRKLEDLWVKKGTTDEEIVEYFDKEIENKAKQCAKEIEEIALLKALFMATEKAGEK